MDQMPERLEKLKAIRRHINSQPKLPGYDPTKLQAKIDRARRRIVNRNIVQKGFDTTTINGIKIELIDGRVTLDFGYPPSEATRDRLKRSPLAFRYAWTTKLWQRRHTETTCGEYFWSELRGCLNEADM
jgi:hypothetical protein